MLFLKKNLLCYWNTKIQTNDFVEVFCFPNKPSVFLILCVRPTASKVSKWNTKFFLVRFFPPSDWIRRDTEYLSVFSQNAGKYGPEQLRIRTLFTQYRETFFVVFIEDDYNRWLWNYKITRFIIFCKWRVGELMWSFERLQEGGGGGCENKTSTNKGEEWFKFW